MIRAYSLSLRLHHGEVGHSQRRGRRQGEYAYLNNLRRNSVGVERPIGLCSPSTGVAGSPPGGVGPSVGARHCLAPTPPSALPCAAAGWQASRSAGWNRATAIPATPAEASYLFSPACSWGGVRGGGGWGGSIAAPWGG